MGRANLLDSQEHADALAATPTSAFYPALGGVTVAVGKPRRLQQSRRGSNPPLHSEKDSRSPLRIIPCSRNYASLFYELISLFRFIGNLTATR